MLIHSFTRADALKSGVLIDITPLAQEAGFVYPVAVTDTVFQAYIQVPPDVFCQDVTGRTWDILIMLRFFTNMQKRKGQDTDTILFVVNVRNDNNAPKPINLKAVCHPGDQMDPVLTIMLPYED